MQMLLALDVVALINRIDYILRHFRNDLNPCAFGEFWCGEDTECISLLSICDGKTDCSNAKDER